MKGTVYTRLAMGEDLATIEAFLLTKASVISRLPTTIAFITDESPVLLGNSELTTMLEQQAKIVASLLSYATERSIPLAAHYRNISAVRDMLMITYAMDLYTATELAIKRTNGSSRDILN